MGLQSFRIGLPLFLSALLGLWSGAAQAGPHMSMAMGPPSNADNDASNSITVGDVLTYTAIATNDGTVVLTNVQITESGLTPNTNTCASVAINATCVLTGTHTVTPADGTNGQVFLNPKATANEDTNGWDTGRITPVVTGAGAGMTVVITLNNYNDVDNNNVSSVGDKLDVVVTATNAGSVALHNVNVTESQTGGSMICATVPAGATCVMSAAYTLTPADVVVNAVTVFNGSATSTEVPGPVSFSTDAEFDGGSVDSAQFLIVSGNNQGGAPNTTLPLPLKIRLLDTTGAPVAGESIQFIVGMGSATASTPIVVTDALGEASTQLVLGPTPGPVGVYVVPEDEDGPSVFFIESNGGLAPATTLSIVSGDGQSLVPDVSSAPLVVVLKDSFNAPIVGATVNWTSSTGTLDNASTVTDSNGESSNAVTASTSGPITVTASSPLASALVTFTLSGTLAELPGLTPAQQEVAASLDNACSALSDVSSPSPQEADLLAQCQALGASAGVDSSATADALESLLNKTAEAQSTAASVAIDAQIHNIQSRLLALRSGAATSNANGLSFTGPGGTISLGSLLAAFGDGDASPANAGDGFSKWGFFATGNIGRGEADANSASPGFDYDINGITAGIDYRLRDDWILGGALGYTRQDTDLDDDSGEVDMRGWSISGYSTWSFGKSAYVDGVLTYGRNQLNVDRVIRYTLPLPGGGSTSIDQLASGEPDGSLFSAAITFGGDFHRQAWGFSPYGQLVYSRVDFDAYEESMRAGAGSGLALAVDERRITELAGILGSRVTWTHSAAWGVFAPTASLEWNHEFRSDQKATIARFVYDPTHTPFSVSGEDADSDYLRLGLGMTWVLTHGRSGFVLYQRTLAREGQSQGDLSIGIRIEF